MARIIIVRGHDTDVLRMKGTALEVQFPDEQLELMESQVRHSIDLASRIYVVKKVSEARSHVPAPGSKEAFIMGCKCQGPSPDFAMKQYRLHPDCIVHKGRWPGL